MSSPSAHQPDLDATLAGFGERVRARRQAAGLTVEQLAVRAGLSRRFVTLIEHGTGNISLSRLYPLAKTLGCSVHDLLPGGAASDARAPVIALLGVRGAGKTTLGTQAAAALNLPFVELDRVVENDAGLALGEIFAVHGESYFRRLELGALERVVTEGRATIVATGGGIVTSEPALALLRARCHSVWLKATPDDHWDRVVERGDRRPAESRPDARTELRDLLRRRAGLYAMADLVIDTSRLGRAAAERRLVGYARRALGLTA